ncbi:nucleotide sugar dehydrogenase [Patescibacteria group bacterium]|nr:nucleotide sugar dehydrogenase [Patescibacteria group bacterium]MBU4512516.1 nucleotide sugar dehydrogenase [Patescibacteria group bacterium]MCG2693505.1 nucleotide sugar dehydrogenase [Candidatus Parcubacteria bacterium]
MTNQKICIVGLGYVGLPLAALFSTTYDVVGFDINEKRIKELKQGKDSTGEVEDIANYNIEFTTDAHKISHADFVIVAVHTPIDRAKNPDLGPLRSASKIVGQNLKNGAIVVYESTVYPGCTEEICAPILEQESGKKCGADFKVGYSPERVNPADKEHTIDKIVKVVSGCDKITMERIAELYGSVITAGVHKASSIKVAEAAKVIENIKRDLNIALVNELSLIFEKLGINTREVLEAAGTKWNFNSGKYYPGLVGGHCISVDPYYLTHKALEVGYHPQIILAGRATNEYMARHVAEMTVKELSLAGKVLKDSKVLIMGLTFKENVPDTRNSQAKRVIEYLKEFGVDVYGYEPLLKDDIEEQFGVENIKEIKPFDKLRPGKLRNREIKDDDDPSDQLPVTSDYDTKFDAVIIFSPHNEFKKITLDILKNKMNDKPIIVDIKEFFNKDKAKELGFAYRSL